jgi:hypothetical protein
MPIRFRCKYCNQLLGIARRKAGTDVSCPTCHGRLTVPRDDLAEFEGGPALPSPLFERSDFEDYLRSPFGEEAVGHTAASGGRGGRPGPSAASEFDVERLPVEHPPAAPPAPAGIVLSRSRLTVLAVTAVLLLAAAFAAGIGVDRLFLAAPAP